MAKLFTAGQVAYYAGWFFKSKLGIKNPLVNTMIINYECNLRCKHCSIAAHKEELPRPHSISYNDALREMKEHYDRGTRILFFEGGEPTLWNDDGKNLRDLIIAGKKMGYFVTGYTTHGLNTFYEDSDVISVSIDGTREVHDSIRGAGVFDKMTENLSKTTHGNIFANMVVMKENLKDVEATVKMVAKNQRIRGIMINFITPPPYELALSPEEKREVIDLVLRLKKEGYPVLNTKKALRGLLEEDWSAKCPYWISAFVMPNLTKFQGCPMANTASCKKCGFNAVREYRLISKGSLETITDMSKRFALSKR